MAFAGAGMLVVLGALCRAFGTAPEAGVEDFSTVFSARDLSCSDQLKPSPERREDMSDFILGERLALLALALASVDEDKPRPLEVGGETKVEALPLAALLFPARTSLSALAPKLMRRAKGEAGGGPVASPSSMTFSSSVTVPMDDVEPTLVLLSRRARKGDVCVGDPDKPSVVKDIRRRFWACALAAADVIGPGYAEVAFAPEAGVRTKSSEKVWPGENDARRRCDGDGGESFSLDMVGSYGGERRRLADCGDGRGRGSVSGSGSSGNSID
ncbi:MAG: hypothetical protein M1840_001003 [Geoglossum simile]|nr:MAG: hypothetical protein M1840_001003 [Geoglossum simile]